MAVPVRRRDVDLDRHRVLGIGCRQRDAVSSRPKRAQAQLVAASQCSRPVGMPDKRLASDGAAVGREALTDERHHVAALERGAVCRARDEEFRRLARRAERRRASFAGTYALRGEHLQDAAVAARQAIEIDDDLGRADRWGDCAVAASAVVTLANEVGECFAAAVGLPGQAHLPGQLLGALRRDDAHLRRILRDLDRQHVVVRVTASLGVRDWSGDVDDDYEGIVHRAVIAET